jgi:uncharacterized protein YdaU (DUF1376 family)
MPFFPIYANELLADEDFQAWNPAERGCWLTLTARCWSDGSIPSNIERMAKLCSCNAEEMLKHWPSISSKFEESQTEGRLISRRIEKERLLAIGKAEKISSRGKSGATARWAKEKEVMPKQCLSNAQGMLDDGTSPSPSPSPSTTTTTTAVEVGVAALPRIKRPKTPKAPKEAPGMFPKPVIDAVNAICLSCPKEDGDDHRKIRIDAATLADRITGILEASPEVKIEILTQAWTDYLASKPFRVKAPQYFFGKADDNGDGANWRPFARLVWHKMAKLAEKNQPYPNEEQ